MPFVFQYNWPFAGVWGPKSRRQTDCPDICEGGKSISGENGERDRRPKTQPPDVANYFTPELSGLSKKSSGATAEWGFGKNK